VAEIASVLEVLESIAPLRLAAEWDNVGLLVEGEREIHRIVLCIDLTEFVLAEAIGQGADLVVAYHPPIFQGLTRFTSSNGRVVQRAIRAGLHVYSPHTALDAASDGMTDWLVRAVGEVYGLAPIVPDVRDPSLGAGRTATLRTPAPLLEIVARIKTYLGVSVVRVASQSSYVQGDPGLVHTVAACPGAGSDIVGRARDADLVLTGEMRHHEILSRVAKGSAVVLTDHTHSERGFLPILARRLADRLPGVSVSCSMVDKEPLVPR
jgi:dinuclear metal center YbgI/SA1388 family protein